MVSSQLDRIVMVDRRLTRVAVSRFAHGSMVSSQLDRIVMVDRRLTRVAVSRFAHGISS